MCNVQNQYCSNENCGEKFAENHVPVLLPASKMHLVAVLCSDPADMPFCNADCRADFISQVEECREGCDCADCSTTDGEEN